jgi:hypothetical protein
LFLTLFYVLITLKVSLKFIFFFILTQIQVFSIPPLACLLLYFLQ